MAGRDAKKKQTSAANSTNGTTRPVLQKIVKENSVIESPYALRSKSILEAISDRKEGSAERTSMQYVKEMSFSEAVYALRSQPVKTKKERKNIKRLSQHSLDKHPTKKQNMTVTPPLPAQVTSLRNSEGRSGRSLSRSTIEARVTPATTPNKLYHLLSEDVTPRTAIQNFLDVHTNSAVDAELFFAKDRESVPDQRKSVQSVSKVIESNESSKIGRSLDDTVYDIETEGDESGDLRIAQLRRHPRRNRITPTDFNTVLQKVFQESTQTENEPRIMENQYDKASDGKRVEAVVQPTKMSARKTKAVLTSASESFASTPDTAFDSSIGRTVHVPKRKQMRKRVRKNKITPADFLDIFSQTPYHNDQKEQTELHFSPPLQSAHHSEKIDTDTGLLRKDRIVSAKLHEEESEGSDYRNETSVVKELSAQALKQGDKLKDFKRSSQRKPATSFLQASGDKSAGFDHRVPEHCNEEKLDTNNTFGKRQGEHLQMPAEDGVDNYALVSEEITYAEEKQNENEEEENIGDFGQVELLRIEVKGTDGITEIAEDGDTESLKANHEEGQNDEVVMKQKKSERQKQKKAVIEFGVEVVQGGEGTECVEYVEREQVKDTVEGQGVEGDSKQLVQTKEQEVPDVGVEKELGDQALQNVEQEFDAEEKIQDYDTKEGMQESDTEEGMQESDAEEGMQDIDAEERMQESDTEERMQESDTEERMQESDAEERMQESDTEEDKQDNNTEEDRQDNDIEEDRQDSDTEEGMQKAVNKEDREDGIKDLLRSSGPLSFHALVPNAESTRLSALTPRPVLVQKSIKPYLPGSVGTEVHNGLATRISTVTAAESARRAQVFHPRREAVEQPAIPSHDSSFKFPAAKLIAPSAEAISMYNKSQVISTSKKPALRKSELLDKQSDKTPTSRHSQLSQSDVPLSPHSGSFAINTPVSQRMQLSATAPPVYLNKLSATSTPVYRNNLSATGTPAYLKKTLSATGTAVYLKKKLSATNTPVSQKKLSATDSQVSHQPVKHYGSVTTKTPDSGQSKSPVFVHSESRSTILAESAPLHKTTVVEQVFRQPEFSANLSSHVSQADQISLRGVSGTHETVPALGRSVTLPNKTIHSYFPVVSSKKVNTTVQPQGPSARVSVKPKSKRQSSTDCCVSYNQARGIFKHYSKCRVSVEAMREAHKAGEEFLDKFLDELIAIVDSAGRNTITCDDVKLLMMREGLIKDDQDLYALIAEYLPLEYRKELIPCALAGNEIYPPPKGKISGAASKKRNQAKVKGSHRRQ